ncbi:predicted protein [Nematostella vectensis]|uniref:Uncharacterized protein n=1 Tax=Nematostella vectensis TaxID=45351 RepID=A7RUK9_NEMVE|nr:predicted protein [Nematostella vectensis]|eukprot:XP_001636934.1 predicted protein [Nematostella vectensis]
MGAGKEGYTIESRPMLSDHTEKSKATLLVSLEPKDRKWFLKSYTDLRYITVHNLAKYFTSKLKNEKEFVHSFENYFSVAAMVPNVIMFFLNTLFKHKVKLQTRMVTSLVLMTLLFVLTTVLVKIKTTSSTGTINAIIDKMSTYLLAMRTVATAVYQGGLFGLSGMMPAKYTGAVMTGQGIGGTFAALASIIFTAIWGQDDPITVGFGYFLSAVVMLFLCIITYILLPSLNFARHFMGHSSRDQVDCQNVRYLRGRKVEQQEILKNLKNTGDDPDREIALLQRELEEAKAKPATISSFGKRNPVYRGGSMKNLSSKDKDIILRQKTEELDVAMQEMKRLEKLVKTQKTVKMCDTCEAESSIEDLRLQKKKREIELVEQQEILNNLKNTGDDLDSEIALLQRELEEANAKPATAEIACQANVEMSDTQVQTTCASTNECETQTEVTNTIKVTQETQTDTLPKRRGNPVTRAWRRLRERVRGLRDRLFPGAAVPALSIEDLRSQKKKKEIELVEQQEILNNLKNTGDDLDRKIALLQRELEEAKAKPATSYIVLKIYVNAETKKLSGTPIKVPSKEGLSLNPVYRGGSMKNLSSKDKDIILRQKTEELDVAMQEMKSLEKLVKTQKTFKMCDTCEAESSIEDLHLQKKKREIELVEQQEILNNLKNTGDDLDSPIGIVIMTKANITQTKLKTHALWVTFKLSTSKSNTSSPSPALLSLVTEQVYLIYSNITSFPFKTEELDVAMQEMKRLEKLVKTEKLDVLLYCWSYHVRAGQQDCQNVRYLRGRKVEQQEILKNLKNTGDDPDREIALLQRELEEAKAKPATAEIACQANVEMSDTQVQTTCASTNESETQTEVTNTIKVTQETQTDPLPKRQGNPVTRAWRRFRERVRGLRDRLFPGAAVPALNPVYRGGSMKNLSSKDKDIILRQKTEELDVAMQEMKRLEKLVKTQKLDVLLYCWSYHVRAGQQGELEATSGNNSLFTWAYPGFKNGVCREIALLQRELEEAKTKPATANVEMSDTQVQTTCASTNECETQTEVTNTIKVTQETQTDPLPKRQGNPVTRAWRRLRERARGLRDRLFPGAAVPALGWLTFLIGL